MITPLPPASTLSIEPRAYIESRDHHAGWCEIRTQSDFEQCYSITVMNPSSRNSEDSFYNTNRMASRIIKALTLLDALEGQNFIIAKRD